MTCYVSFSGGADSLALLCFALEEYGRDSVAAVHFEHGFRGQESLDDQHFCERVCQSLGVPLTVIPLSVPEKKLPEEGDEAAARRLRLDVWRNIIRPDTEDAVLLGHHADDAAETLLMRLFRGSNVSGLTGLRRERVIGGIRFLRPLLDWTRADILRFLAERGMTEYCTDSTNLEDGYFRNFLRNTVLPAVAEHAPYAPGGLRRSVQNLLLDADYIEQAAEAAYAVCQTGRTADWKTLHPAILIRVLRKFLPEEIIPEHHLAERLHAALRQESGETKTIPVNREYSLVLDPQEIRLCRNGEKETFPAWDWRNEPDCYGLSAEVLRGVPENLNDGAAYFDAEKMPSHLYLTEWREGDTILSFDGKRKNLKKLFCDKHIPAHRRLVLRGGDGTVYLAVGVRHSAEAPVANETKQTLKITVKE